MWRRCVTEWVLVIIIGIVPGKPDAGVCTMWERAEIAPQLLVEVVEGKTNGELQRSDTQPVRMQRMGM